MTEGQFVMKEIEVRQENYAQGFRDGLMVVCQVVFAGLVMGALLIYAFYQFSS